MKKLIFITLIFLSGAFMESKAQTPLPTLTLGTTLDTIAGANASDTSRRFLNNKQFRTINVEIFKGSVWRTYQILYLVEDVYQFRVKYAGDVDSTATIEGRLSNTWVQLPIYDYSTGVARTILLSGGSDALIRFRGFDEYFKPN